ncbi:MAG TPA: prenyltransferase [Gemmatimonadales bacterium]|nr:prenyltransferase [Gemmatimonadales bacterium]
MTTVAGISGVARLPFLALPLALVASGAAAQEWAGTFSWPRTLLALAGLLAMHVAVNALNEAADFESGIDLVTVRTPFSGGSGAIPGRQITAGSARRVGRVALLAGAAIGAWFIATDGLALAPILAAGVVLVAGYSTGFARAGWGEVAAGLGLGFLPVVGTALAQGAPASTAAWAAAVPAFFLTFDLLLLNEFPDETADRAGRRRNLVLRLGRQRAARVYLLAALAVPGAILLGVGTGAIPRTCLLGLVPSLLLALPAGWALREPERPVPVRALAANVLWNLGTNALLALGFVLG